MLAGMTDRLDVDGRHAASAPVGPALLAGFVVGFLGTFAATALALLLGTFERLLSVLVPARVLLRPLSDVFADWNGLVTMTVTGVVNGAVYALLALLAVVLVAAARSAARHR